MSTPDELTPRQAKILDFIKKAIATNGYPPTVREIGEKVGLASPASVKYQLEILAAKGLIKKADTSARAIEVTDEAAPSKSRNIPLVGQIAAGIPITAEQNVEEIHTLPESMVGKGDLYMLKVKGDSMIDAAICDGDFVVVRQQKSANKGEIVAALLDGEATVKYWSMKNNKPVLLPANPAFKPIPAEHAEILGKVVTVLRKV
jgi:repressor LexA